MRVCIASHILEEIVAPSTQTQDISNWSWIPFLALSRTLDPLSHRTFRIANVGEVLPISPPKFPRPGRIGGQSKFCVKKSGGGGVHQLWNIPCNHEDNENKCSILPVGLFKFKLGFKLSGRRGHSRMRRSVNVN